MTYMILTQIDIVLNKYGVTHIPCPICSHGKTDKAALANRKDDALNCAARARASPSGAGSLRLSISTPLSDSRDRCTGTPLRIIYGPPQLRGYGGS